MPCSSAIRRCFRKAAIVLFTCLLVAGDPAAASQLSAQFQNEVEPNGNTVTATPIIGTAAVLEGNISPTGDADLYSFAAQAGDRVHAATMTSLTTVDTTGDTLLTLLSTDGITVLESDDDDGAFASDSSSIAGTTIPFNGTYYLRVTRFNDAGEVRPYRLYFQLRSGTPTAEVEPNDTFPGAALPATRWVAGTLSSSSDIDFYAVALNAGDTVYASLDLDPERDGVDSSGNVGVGNFGSPALALEVGGTGSGTPDSETISFTVKSAGTYAVKVLGGTGTYRLSVSIFPKINDGVSCTTYTSTGGAVSIPTGPTLIASTLTVPGNPRIEDLDVSISLTHTRMSDLDVELSSPGGNTVGLFSDMGSSAQQGMEMTLDDEAALPMTTSFDAMSQTTYAPEPGYRLSWFDGQPAGGTWTLHVRDDSSNSGGTLQNWSLRICQMPTPPACPAGHTTVVAYQSDFESSDGGFTHNGSQDEWERGLPAFAPITTCASGSQCWKTDLDNTYNANASQNLLSPSIDLSGLSPPVIVSWSHKYQMGNASLDHYWVDAREVAAPLNTQRLFEHRAADMINSVGSPEVITQESAGWGLVNARADALAGKATELLFHVDSDSTNNRAGVGVDDVKVTACRAPAPDISVTKTDGATTAIPGQSTTYTIVVRNTGQAASPTTRVVDTLPAGLTCSWTCTGTGGATCPATGSGNIDHDANLPIGGVATWSMSCAIAPGATGALSNTVSGTSTGNVDPTPLDNSATDTTTLSPSGNLTIAKSVNTPTAVAGNTLVYTITTTNAGPSTAAHAIVGDVFAASLACTWTCAGADGATCAGSGSGTINADVTLPPGGTATHTATCAIASAAVGALSNTATVTAPAGFVETSTADNASTATTTVGRTADLSVAKTDGVANVSAGATTTYTIVAANAGPSDAPATHVVDTLPASLACTWTCTGTAACTANGTGNIDDTIDLAAGTQATYTLACTVAGTATGSITNTASVTASAGVTDPSSANNAASDTDTVVPRADLAVTITDSRNRVRVGQVLNYVIIANNSGPNTANATLSAQLAAELGNASWSCVPSGGANCGTANGTGTAMSNAVSLPTGGQVTSIYTATVLASNPLDTLATSAAIVGTGSNDPVAGNNNATDTDVLVLFADNFESGGVTLVEVATGERRRGLVLSAPLLADLSAMPVTLLSAEAADGKTAFDVDVARFGDRLVMRNVVGNVEGWKAAQPWRVAWLDGALLRLDWSDAAEADVVRLRVRNHGEGAAAVALPSE